MAAITVKSVIDGLMGPLLAEGFRQRHPHAFIWEASDEAYGFLNFQVSQSFGAIDVIPSVGIRHERLMRTICDLGVIVREVHVTVGFPLALENQLHNVPSRVRRRGKKKSGRYRWLFTRPDEIKRHGPSFRDAIRDFAIPYVAQWSRLRTLADGLRKEACDEVDISHLAVALHLLGEDDEAFAVLRGHLQKMDERPQYRKERFKQLVAALLPKLDLSPKLHAEKVKMEKLASKPAVPKRLPDISALINPPKPVAKPAAPKVPKLRTFVPGLMAPLIDAGFAWLERAPRSKKRRPGGIYWKRINAEIIGYVVPNSQDAGSVQSWAEIQPRVGVIHEPLRRLVRELQGQPVPAGDGPDLGCKAFGLCFHQLPGIDFKKLKLEPSDRYSFESAADVEKKGPLVKACLIDAVLPFLERLRTLHDITECLENMEGKDEFDDYERALAAALHMMGRHDDAFQFMRRHLREVQRRRDELDLTADDVQDPYENFSDALIRLIERSGWTKPGR